MQTTASKRLPSDVLGEKRVRGKRAVQDRVLKRLRAAEGLELGGDHALFLAAEEPGFARVRIEAGHRDARGGDAPVAREGAQPFAGPRGADPGG